MTIRDQLRANFPKTIDKSAPVFSALVANDEGTGAFEYELNHLIQFMSEWTQTPDVYQQTGEMLDMTIKFFSFLERFTDEKDKSIKNRFAAIFIRNHDQIWGNPYDVKRVFEQYFPSADIYYMENTNDFATENLITDGDFTTGSAEWTYTGGAAVDRTARFSKAYGVLMPQSSTLSQEIDIDNAGTYFVHFFLKGDVKVAIKNNDNDYWDPETETWGATAAYTTFTKDEWDNCSLFFITDQNMTSIEVEFTGNAATDACIDYVRLFEKQTYSSFTIIAHFEGTSGGETMKLAPGVADPATEISDYGLYDYFDHTYVSGVAAGFAQDIYTDLLNLLRPQGVKAYLDIVVKDI